jgi:hypothetical protein
VLSCIARETLLDTLQSTDGNDSPKSAVEDSRSDAAEEDPGREKVEMKAPSAAEVGFEEDRRVCRAVVMAGSVRSRETGEGDETGWRR